MTIEQKAEAYDNALKVLHKYDGANIMFSQSLKEEMFPELREIDDEKVMEQIVYAIKQLHVCDCTKNKLCAWLLERCEQKPIVWSKEDERIRNILLLSFKNIMRDADKDELWYGLSYNDIIGWLEKQGKQKPTDNVEPKFNFKVGQWIVSTGKCIYLITKIDGFNVTLVDTNGNEYMFDVSSLDDAYQWYIADAKDGDVLTNDDASYIVLFKRFFHSEDDVNIFNSHCHCREGIFSFIEDTGWRCDGFHPATKEQRDLLFQRMKDAGYEWDAEKKELKKINQKSAWCKADEHAFDNCIYAIKETFKGEDNPHRIVTINWLESFKDKIQTNQEWNEEDEKMLNSFLHKLEVCDLLSIKESRWISNKLKSLRHHSIWKPSEEQLKELENVFSPDTDSWDEDILRKLYNDLKKLTE